VSSETNCLPKPVPCATPLLAHPIVGDLEAQGLFWEKMQASVARKDRQQINFLILD